MNLPPKYLNADTAGGLNYANVEQEKRDLVDLTLRPYIHALEARLSLPDVTPRGQQVLVDLDDFYRGDLMTAATVDTTELAAGITNVDEIRARRGDPPLGTPSVI